MQQLPSKLIRIFLKLRKVGFNFVASTCVENFEKWCSFWGLLFPLSLFKMYILTISKLRNCILCIACGYYFFQTGLYKSAFYTYSFGKLVFHLPLVFLFSVTSVFYIWCPFLDICNICMMIVCIDATWSVILLSRWFVKKIESDYVS